MHIPDGFLSPPVWATLDLAAIPAVGWIASRARRETDERQVPLLGVMGAFVFAAQMINFPAGVGTSGHLAGGALLAVVLGPAAAVMVMTAILIVQALVFQDGGVLALGANVVNMALIGVAAGYLPCRIWGRRKAAIFTGGLLSIATGGAMALSELLLSGIRMPGYLLAGSMGVFLANGLAEGVLTVLVVEAMGRLRSGAAPAIETGPAPVSIGRRSLGVLAIAAILMAAGGLLVASADPDGVARIGQDLALREAAWFKAPLGGYALGDASFVPGWAKGSIIGLGGAGLIAAACLAGGRLLAGRRSD